MIGWSAGRDTAAPTDRFAIAATLYAFISACAG